MGLFGGPGKHGVVLRGQVIAPNSSNAFPITVTSEGLSTHGQAMVLFPWPSITTFAFHADTSSIALTQFQLAEPFSFRRRKKRCYLHVVRENNGVPTEEVWQIDGATAEQATEWCTPFVGIGR